MTLFPAQYIFYGSTILHVLMRKTFCYLAAKRDEMNIKVESWNVVLLSGIICHLIIIRPAAGRREF